MSDLQKRFKEEIGPKLQQRLKVKNPMAVPKLSKILINMGVREALSDKKRIEKEAELIAQITGQKPKVTAAKKAIASFKLREGDKIGLVVTLRGNRMYNFFDKLITAVLPRLKDFHGVNRESFDSRGNYSIGFSEQVVFPEIDQGKLEGDLLRQGLELTIVTTAKDKEEGLALLEEMGMPFKK